MNQRFRCALCAFPEIDSYVRFHNANGNLAQTQNDLYHVRKGNGSYRLGCRTTLCDSSTPIAVKGRKAMCATVTLELLGGCTIRLNGSPLNSLSSKAQALLIYLAVTNIPHRRVHLASLFWSEIKEPQALANLRKALHEIKLACVHSSSFVIDANRQSLKLSPKVKVVVDAVAFDTDLKDGEISIEQLELITNQYHGDFLNGFYLRGAPQFEEWCDGTRTRLHNIYITVLLCLSKKYEAEADFEAAIRVMIKLLRFEPLREDLHLRLMELYVCNGQRIGAMQQYERCVKILESELDTQPDIELTEFYQKLHLQDPVEETKDSHSYLHKFVVGPPVVQPELFFGRQNHLSRIFGWWQQPPFGHVAITGHRRSGKTSLLQHLKPISGYNLFSVRPGQRTRWLQSAEQYRWIYIDFQDPRMRSQPSLLCHLLRGFHIEPPEDCTLERFMDLATASAWGTPTLILMDELEAGLASDELNQSFWWTLRALTQMTDGLIGIALASRDQPMKVAECLDKSSPFFNIFTTLEIGPFEKSEALEFIDSIDHHYTTEERQWILARSGCWPCLLQLLCQEKYLAGKQENGDQEWRGKALHQVQSYAHLFE